jgi:hypothetical protein
MAAQVLAEMAQETKDEKLLLQIYNSILFDFRIWCKSEFFVQVFLNNPLASVVVELRDPYFWFVELPFGSVISFTPYNSIL